ncbi:MAG TPA: prepilin-type N-terminal cleavage/methylation domain-containing protein [Fimbriimonadaceae bacterium]|jgi:prepilin-type N-terminal cleavage/methylation domain-containing protein/prepilin-type processing-associated H-X9-DG protein
MKGAFTLIELLVVIAIIAILAAILFPVFAQAKLAAKRTVALSNAKQLALSIAIYQNDYDDAVVKSYFGAPPECASPAGNWGGVPGTYIFDWYSWRHAILPYTSKSTQLLTDPTNQFNQPAHATDIVAIPGAPDNVDLTTNFAGNGAILGFANAGCWNSANENPGLDTLDGLSDPADTILLAPNRTNYITVKWMFGNNHGEAGKFNGLATVDDGQVLAPYNCITPIGATSPTCPASGMGALHSNTGQMTFVWCDGHAKTKTYTQTLATGNANSDEWDSAIQPNDDNTVPTQADRVWVSQHLFNEYK